jgi:putative transposase
MPVSRSHRAIDARRHGVRAIMTRPCRVRTTDSRHDFPIAPNVLEQNFIATAPTRIWLPYVETDQGRIYLTTVMDLYSCKIIGRAMADRGFVRECFIAFLIRFLRA